MLDLEHHQQTDSYRSSTGIDDLSGHSGGGHSSETIVTVLWRFKWLLLIFVACGLGVGYWYNQKKPTTYRASAKVMFRSDKPLILNSSTGMMEGGIPGGNIMQSIVTSDSIMQRVSEDDGLKAVPMMDEMSEAQIANTIRSGFKFQTLTNAAESRDRMIAALSFESGDKNLCVSAVNALSSAIRAHFNKERETQIEVLRQVFTEEYSELKEKFDKLESEYQAFQTKSMLKWDKDHNAINPYRERQISLQTDREVLETEIREIERELRTAQLIKEQTPSPIMIAQMIGRFAGVGDFAIENQIKSPTARAASLLSDVELENLDVEEQLVPLETDRAELISQLGENHPQVQSITLKIDNFRRRLMELEKQKAERQAELLANSEEVDTSVVRREAQERRARDFVNAYTGSLQQRLVVLREDVAKLDANINQAETLADQLQEAENKEKSYNRRLDFYKSTLEEMDQRIAELDLTDSKGGILVESLDNTSNAFVVGPDLKKDLALFGLAGLGISGLFAMLFEVSAKMFRSAEEIQRDLRLPVLAHVPVEEGRSQRGKPAAGDELATLDPKIAVVHSPYSAAAEAVRGIRTALLFDRRGHNSKVFQITSPLPGDGKSTLASNVACSLAQSGKKVLLIDLDLRSPRLSLRFNLESDHGLTNVLNGEMAPDEAIHDSAIEHLDVLPCGPLPANPAEALTLSELGDVFDWARANYDFVIVDTPPVLMVSDPAVVTAHVDAAMLVMRIRRRCKPNAKEAVAMLRLAGARVMGVVVNKIDEVSGGATYRTSASGSYQSIGYGYGDRYRRRYQQEANVQDTYVVKGKMINGRDAATPATPIQPSPIDEDSANGLNGNPVAPADPSSANRQAGGQRPGHRERRVEQSST